MNTSQSKRHTTLPRGAPGTEPSRGGFFWAGLVWVASLIALGWGVYRLERYTAAMPPGEPCRLEWVDLPAWLTTPASQPILHEIIAAAQLSPDADIRDPDLCRQVGENLRHSPWIAAVKSVRKLPTGIVCVRATFREPFAFVQAGSTVYLVDREGIRLPLRYEVASVDERYWNDWFRIAGVQAPIPAEGELWPGEDLAAGLRLIEFLRQAAARGEVPFRPLLRVIDVTNYGRRVNAYEGDLRIQTTHPATYVDWGLPPDEEYNVESSASRKLAMLRALYENQSQFPPMVLDVRGADGIRLRQPRGG